MPTGRNGKVRRMLRDKKAVVVSRSPFTIRLLYKTLDITQPLILGLDPGRQNIGISVVDEKARCVYSSKTETINKQIPVRMKARKAKRMERRTFRRRMKRRRAVKHDTAKGVFERHLPGCEEPVVCHDIRNSEARFNNRKRPKGWLTPTANHLLQTHLNLIRKVRSILPVTDVCPEINRFAFMKMDNPDTSGIDFQKGSFAGYNNLHEAVAEEQHHKCLLCGGKIEHYHHIVMRKKNGADTIDNIAGLCRKCHDTVHKDKEAKKLLKSKKKGVAQKYEHLSIVNQIIPYLWKALEEDNTITVHATDGYETSVMRKLLNLPKDHDVDAYIIACNGAGIEPKKVTLDSYQIRQFRRHNRAIRQTDNYNRVYLLDGKAVAANRHKSSTQTTDSLEEFRKTHTEQEITKLTVKPHEPQYRQKHEYMPGSIFIHNGKTYVLKNYEGTHVNKKGVRQSKSCVDTNGNRHNFKQCVFIQHHVGLRYT
jgi:hypothetical protein